MNPISYITPPHTSYVSYGQPQINTIERGNNDCIETTPLLICIIPVCIISCCIYPFIRK